MATYVFETMTPAQALPITPNDHLVFSTGTAVQVSVAYLANGDVAITSQGRTLEFNVSITATGFPFRFLSDNSLLWVGGPDQDLLTYAIQPPAPGNAAFGGPGDDIFELGLVGGLLQGNQGNDSMSSAGSQATIYGGQGDDSITVFGSAHDNFIQGNKGDDVLVGASAADTILGGQGNDTISGHGGADFLNGNLGNDQVTGGGQIFGEDGDDTLTGNFGNDTVSGGNGNDKIALAFHGFADGGPGNDSISLSAVDGDSTLSGGDGNDQIDAHFGETGTHQTLTGDNGDDSIIGGRGGDTISGGLGNDTIDNGNGAATGPADVLSGGPGQDQFNITATSFSSAGGSPLYPTITDWESGDRIHFNFGGSAGTSANYSETTAVDAAAALSAATATATGATPNYVAVQVGVDVLVFAVSSVGHDQVILAGRQLSDIDFSNIV